MLMLVTTQEVESRMVIGSIAAALPAINSAVKAAHLRVASELDTVFERGVYTHVYLLDETKTGDIIPDGMFRLRLKNGFVRRDTAPVVTHSGSTDEVGEPVLGAQFDYDRGFVFVPASYKGSHVRVVYDAGFDTGEDVPEPLKEAILGYVPAIFHVSQPIKAKDKGSAQETSNYAAAHAMAVLTPYRRRMGFSLEPIF